MATAKTKKSSPKMGKGARKAAVEKAMAMPAKMPMKQKKGGC